MWPGGTGLTRGYDDDGVTPRRPAIRVASICSRVTWSRFGVLSLRAGNHLPSRICAWCDSRLFVVVVRVVKVKIILEFGDGETLPPIGLLQERPALKWTKGRCLTVQRSCCAISAHVFQNDLPTHTHQLILPLRPHDDEQNHFSIRYRARQSDGIVSELLKLSWADSLYRVVGALVAGRYPKASASIRAPTTSSRPARL